MYTKNFEIRWSDVDANRHLRNSSYIDFMSHTRMDFLMGKGLGQQILAKWNLGPVAFYEHIYYFREVFPGNPISVTLQLKGLSEDGMYFTFLHDFYDKKGKHMAHCEMMGAWINMETRKLTALPKELMSAFETADRADGFKILTKEDTRKFGMRPSDIESV